MKEFLPARYRRVTILLLILVMVIVVGTAGFSLIEDVPPGTGFHMTMATIFTVGFYGDMTIKYLKPSLMTVVRAENHENIDKMYKVGADSVISPELEGGKSMSNVACVSFGKGSIECAPKVPPAPPDRKLK